ncbi:FHA domain-containing protein [Nocardioides sp. AX2bis]|uniref:FHA domain-containing protein n=1 Tax=Nocardioides sp. AX2bis TaxID=2653157 RepID=UPI0012F0484F|nr:FHA domain-containing protein [Nocardioides sp. AX2bis]VXB61505.1 Oxoglutarate dehydrogenase inhibitor [Nocardioides sp. AX2bis]
MPFCTACGRQNPDDARFCAQCGTRLVGADASAGGETPGETTATIQVGAVSPGNDGAKTDTSDKLRAVDAAAVDALPLGHALLVVQKGPGSGSRFLLDNDVIEAGRHQDSSIFLDDVTVSRRHAVFTREGDSFTVADAGSLNGTYVNRDRIEKVRLNDGDEVQIGKYRLVFFSGHDRS